MVHGTFARRTRWICPGSPFGLMLRTRLGETRIEPFRWSGSNSARARQEASSSLRHHLHALIARYPSAHHAIIAHSHGGNIALTALADDRLAGRMLGVVTLGTPFLDAKVIEPRFPLSLVDGLAAASFAGICVFALGAALGNGRAWGLPGILTTTIVAGILAVGTSIGRLMQSYAKAVCDTMPDTRLKAPQLAIIRTSADEAAATISGLRVAGVFVALFWNLLSSRIVKVLQRTLKSIDYFGVRAREAEWTKAYLEVMNRKTSYSALAESDPSASGSKDQSEGRSISLRPLVGRVGGLLRDANNGVRPLGSNRLDTAPLNWAEELCKQVRSSVLPYVPFVVLALLDAQSEGARWFGAAVAFGYGAPAVLALAVNFASIPFSVAMALGVLPCGWTLPLAGPYLDLTAESSPLGTWSVTQLRTQVQGEQLSHSRSHDDPEVFAQSCDWLLSRSRDVANSAELA